VRTGTVRSVTSWTVIDEQTVHPVEAGETLRVDPALLGWERKPEGLCRDEVCIPVPAGVAAGPMDASLLARLLGRPLVVDADERVAAFGASATERADALRSGLAPDFALPDVDGVVHRLSDYRGRKVVLYAYASW
jgi:hypothetical protein